MFPPLPPHLDLFIIAVLGLLFGSFVTMASYRLPRGEDMVLKRSHCPNCGKNLRIADLFPLFSWLFAKGKCRYCQSPVSIRYPLIECTLMLLFLLVYARFGWTFQTGILLLVTSCLMVILVVDLEHYIIPDKAQFALLVLGVIYGALTFASPASMLAGAAAGLATGFLLRFIGRVWKKQEALGLGDVKFLAIAGLYLGPASLPAFFFIAGLAGVVTAFVWKITHKGKLFPFAPSLVVALFISLLFPGLQEQFLRLTSHLIAFSL